MILKCGKKKLFCFDLDETLTPSKQKASEEIIHAFEELLKFSNCAIISGASLNQIRKQILDYINPHHIPQILIFPTCGASLFEYGVNGEYIERYSFKLLEEEKAKIISTFDVPTYKIYGNLFEDKGSQITYSALGQDATSEIKKIWDPDCSKRKAILAKSAPMAPEFEYKIGGTTSIDVTIKGIDKSYAIKYLIQKGLYHKEDILYVGDALYEGGNDFPVLKYGVDCIQTSGIEETVLILKNISEIVKCAIHGRNHK